MSSLPRAARCVPPLLVTALALAPGASAARVKTRCTAKLSPAAVTAGDAAKMTGRVSPHAARAVRLQVKQGKRWLVAARTRSTKDGRFSLTAPTTAAAVLTIRASVAATKRARSAVCGKSVLTINAKGNGGGGGDNPGSGPGGTEAKSAFQAIYALTSDQAEKAGEIAAIKATIDAVDGWYGTQTTGNVIPRWNRGSDGKADVKTVTLAHTAADYAAPGADSFTMVKQDLLALGYPASGGKQKIVVFVDASNADGCGVTGSNVTIVFEAACDIHPKSPTAWPMDATYLTAHEMTHNFGAVPPCAPHAGNGGHVIDDPRDVLYAGPNPRDWANQMLDPGHDDYYATGRSDCPGIESSPFWTATSDPIS